MAIISLLNYHIQSFSQQEILNMIPEKTLDIIRKKDPNPFFQAYSICHEGVSSPRLVESGESKPILWTRRAIQSLARVVLKGVRFFIGHNADNSTENRKVVGKVIASFQKEIEGKLHHVVIAYHKQRDKKLAKRMDVCSQEAEWDLFEKAGKLIADSVKKVTGIALGNSEHDTPAFSGAKRLGMLQAFDNIENKENKQDKQDKQEKGDLEKMTFDEVKKAVRDMNIFPRQLYTLEDIKNDNIFGEIILSNESFKTEIEKLKKDKETLENEKIELFKKEQMSSAKDRLLNIGKEYKVTDKQKTYIDMKFKKGVEDVSDESLKKFVENTLQEYKDIASLFGNEEKIIEDPYSDNTSAIVDKTDYTKAENNELLEEDLEE